MQQDVMTSAKMTKQTSFPAQIGLSGADILNLSPYSSIFFHSSASPTTFTAPSATSDGKSTRSAASVVAAAKNLSRMMSEHKDLLNLYTLCHTQLRKTFEEAETLRQENTNLRIANLELSSQVDLLIQATLQNRYQTLPFSNLNEQCGSSSLSSISEKFGVDFEEERQNGGLKENFASKCGSPKFMTMEKDQEESKKDEEARVTLPKSISVRSNGFLKVNQTPAGFTGNNSSPRPATRIRPPNPVSGPQKVYVRGGSKKDGPIELEVYNQGMFKTELCNKWQETGSCPYGNHCQFAHGIEELRPVIRHPRYKTEVCRMVLSGEPCPYGHRCHFRHALTDEEKLMLQLRLD